MNTFCPQCGKSLTADDKFCRTCGRSVENASFAATSPGAPVVPTGPPQTSSKAVISLVGGLLFFVPLACIAAIVFGHIALSEIKRSAGRLKGEGMAIAGLVLGYLWVAGIPIMLIIAAIAIPNLLRARMAANESSAVATVRTLLTAEITYSTQHPNQGFTCSLAALRGGGLISSPGPSNQKNGYQFELMNCSAEAGSPAITTFRVAAYPVVKNRTGVRAFCADESAVIRVDPGGSKRECLASGAPLE